MKFMSEFQYVNELGQRVIGTVDISETSLQFHDGDHDFKLHFQSSEEIATLVEVLCAMDKALKG
jgi:hypothetical protein